MKNISKFLSFLLVAVIGIGLCTVVFINRPRVQTVVEPIKPRYAVVDTLALGDYPLSTILYGEVVTPSNYEINSHLDTDVLDVYVKEGDYVAPGQPLLQLDTTNIKREIETLTNRRENITISKNQLLKENELHQLIIESSKNKKNASDRMYERKKVLREKQIISEDALNNAQKSKFIIDSEHARENIKKELIESSIKKLVQDDENLGYDLAELTQDLKDANVKAPISGRISSINVTKGHRISKNKILLVIIPDDNYEVHTLIPPMYTYSPTELKSVQSSIVLSDGRSISVRFEHFLPQSERNPYGRIAAFNISKKHTQFFHINQSVTLNTTFPPIKHSYAVPSQSIYYNKYIYLVNESNQIILTPIIRKGSFIKEGIFYSVITFTKEPQYKQFLVSKFPDAVDGMRIDPHNGVDND